MPRLEQPKPLSEIEAQLSGLTGRAQNTLRIDIMASELSRVTDATLGEWSIEWRLPAARQSLQTREALVHEVDGYKNGILVFRDRIRQVDRPPFLIRGGDPRDVNRTVTFTKRTVPTARGTRAIEVDNPVENIEAATLVDLIHTIKVATKDGTQPRIINGPHGTVTTVFADGTDGYVRSADAAWANARAGTGATLDLNAFGTSLLAIGAVHSGSTYTYFETFTKFDCSAIDDGDTVSAATLSIDLQSSASDNGDAVQVRATTDWSTLAAADFVAGASFAGLTLVGEVDYGSIAGSGYTDFTNGSTAASVSKTAVSFYVWGTKFLADNTTPPSDEDGGWLYEPTEAASTTSDPKIVVTHEAAGGSTTRHIGLLTLGAG